MKKEIIKDEQIGFRKGSRTSDHIFKLKTLLCKYLHKAGRVYVCFVDMRKAFDSVLHPALFYKLQQYGINGKFFNVLKSMYSSNTLQVRVDDKLSDKFKSEIGVKQGDNLSPTLFNLFLNDLVSCFDDLCHPVCLGSSMFNSLLYADDIILLSTKADGLQRCLDKLSSYCSSWGLSVNHNKTKVMIFNKSCKLIRETFTIDGEKLQCVKEYKYLGLLLNCGGIFSSTTADLLNRGQKAFFKFKNVFKNGNPSIETLIKVFDHTVKPVLLYSSEVWGMFNNSKKTQKCMENLIFNIYKDQKIEKLNIKFRKYLLGVGNKASNLAVVGELGRYPLYIDVILSMIKYWIRLNTTTSNLLTEALNENYKMFENNQHCWINCIYMILKELDMLKIFTSPKTCGYSDICKVKQLLRDDYVRIWKNEINKTKINPVTNRNENKLRTYCKFKSEFKREKYLEYVKDFKTRSTLSRFRISAHKLEIERGRYTIPKTKLENRYCKQCNLLAIEDEVHFLIECPKYNTFRSELFQKIENKNFAVLSVENKLIWLLINEDKQVIFSLVKYVSTCLTDRENDT